MAPMPRGIAFSIIYTASLVIDIDLKVDTMKKIYSYEI